MEPEIIHITNDETLKKYQGNFAKSIVKTNNDKNKYPKFMNGLEINTIILLFEEKIIGYLNYQIENYVSRKENASKKYIYIESIEIHPEYKGKKFCNLLITKLIEFYKDDETINEYHLDNHGGLLGYKCYTSSFREQGFKPKYKSKMTLERNNIQYYNNEKIKNTNNIRKGKKTLKNLNNSRKYNGYMIFIRNTIH